MHKTTLFVTLNIGLNVGRTSTQVPEGYARCVARDLLLADNMEFRLSTGTYDGNSEPTLIVRFSTTDYGVNGLIEFLEGVASDLGQECVVASISDTLDKYERGIVAYNPDYTGERLTFDYNYFLSF